MALIEIDGLPNLKMVIFHGYVKKNQMVLNTFKQLLYPSIHNILLPNVQIMFKQLLYCII